MGTNMGKVFNDNVHPLKDQFKGRDILIEAGGSIDMDYYDFVSFKGEPPVGIPAGQWQDGTGQQNPMTFKKIRYEGPMPHELKEASKICASCGEKFATDTQLDLHIDMNHLDALEDSTVADKRRSKKG